MLSQFNKKIELRELKSVKHLPYLMGVLALMILSVTMSLDIPQTSKLPGNRLKCCKKYKISFNKKEGAVIKGKTRAADLQRTFL